MFRRAHTTRTSTMLHGAALVCPPRARMVRACRLRRGFTLLELAVVGAIIVILATLAIPSLSGLTRMSSEGAMRTALRSLFSSARVRAATTQRYVGIRFQQDRNGKSYAIMLEQPTPSGDFPNGCPIYDQFCTYLALVGVKDTEPVALPRGVELASPALATASNPDDPALWNPDSTGCVPATTFTVVFSPSGQIVRQRVHVSQRRDRVDPNPPNQVTEWDKVFNLTAAYVDGVGQFPPDVEDKNKKAGLPPNNRTDPEAPSGTATKSADVAVQRMSQDSILIYEQKKRVDTGAAPYTGYIAQQGALVPLNVYTGAPVNTQR